MIVPWCISEAHYRRSPIVRWGVPVIIIAHSISRAIVPSQASSVVVVIIIVVVIIGSSIAIGIAIICASIVIIAIVIVARI